MRCFQMVLAGALVVGAAPHTQAQNYQPVARFYGSMPTGVTVSQRGRIFINFPRWGDNVRFTVAEVKKGRIVPFPSAAISSPHSRLPRSQRLVSVQSVVVDPLDRLWMLDTGSVKLGPTVPDGPKLMAVDLKTNRVWKTIAVPPNVALKTTYLNDIRFDLRRGTGGMAFITDSSDKGPNGIIVVDLASGQSWRRLHDHASTKAERNFVPIVEGKAVEGSQAGSARKTDHDRQRRHRHQRRRRAPLLLRFGFAPALQRERGCFGRPHYERCSSRRNSAR